MKRIYLDNAATTPLEPEVIKAMTGAMHEIYGNPSSTHAAGRKARNEIEQARKKVAGYLNASIGEIFFTSGGTESNNMALSCAVRDLGVRRIISSPVEHHCVLHMLDALKKYQGVQVDFLDVDQKANIDYDQLESWLKENEQKCLVSLMHANNEVGSMLELQRVAAICEEHDTYFHSDTVQSMTHCPIDLSETKIHFISGAPHKFHGPKGIGFIYINNDIRVHPFIEGGSQERNMRGGTENIYGIAGLAKAMELACENMQEYRARIEGLRSYLKDQLSERFEDIEFLGNQKDNYLYTILSVSFPPSDQVEMLLLNLDVHGIYVSSGSACSSGAEKSSHVIEAIGHDPARKVVRFSFSHFNNRDEVDRTVEQLDKILRGKKAVAQ